VSDYISDITAFLREEIRRPAVLFGHSLGALVSGVIASRNPELAAALILEDPPLSVLGRGIRESPFFPQFVGIKRLVNERDVQSDLVRRLAEMPVRNPETGKEVRFDQLRSPQSLHFSAECLSQIDPEVLIPLLDGRWMEGIDMMKEFKEIERPVLLLRGESRKGAMLTLDEAKDLSAELNNCKLVEVLGAGHLIHESQPARTLELLSHFLEPLRKELNLKR
jgi:pimeloyl-ACP methyl ester carboxylesterase